MEFELELGDDAEVAAPAANGPQQVGVARFARLHPIARRQDQVRGDEVVANQAKPPAEPAKPAAERQACHAGMGHDPGRPAKTERLSGRVEVLPERTWL